jgi:hypothetical protein
MGSPHRPMGSFGCVATPCARHLRCSGRIGHRKEDLQVPHRTARILGAAPWAILRAALCEPQTRRFNLSPNATEDK